jgi:hypothetical protein
MRLGLSVHHSLEQRLEQDIECTIRLSQRMADPFEYARELFERSQKVNVPIKIGKYIIVVKAAIVEERELGGIFENERFAGLMARLDEKYQFFNRQIKVPDSVAQYMPRLMAFHCLAAIKMKSFSDETGTLQQYQAIALEMAYARHLMSDSVYIEYLKWRPEVERTDFFKRQDWPEIVSTAIAGFREITEEIHRNAHSLQCAVMVHGETFGMKGEHAVNSRGEEITIHRKIGPKRLLR